MYAARRNMCRRILAAGLITLLMGGLAGCQTSLTGKWYMSKAIPSPDVFAVDDVIFGRDGSYSAKTTIEGRTVVEQGTYSFNGYHLTLNPQSGGKHGWTTYRKHDRIEIKDGKKLVVLKKGTRGG